MFPLPAPGATAGPTAISKVEVAPLPKCIQNQTKTKAVQTPTLTWVLILPFLSPLEARVLPPPLPGRRRALLWGAARAARPVPAGSAMASAQLPLGPAGGTALKECSKKGKNATALRSERGNKWESAPRERNGSTGQAGRERPGMFPQEPRARTTRLSSRSCHPWGDTGQRREKELVQPTTPIPLHCLGVTERKEWSRGKVFQSLICFSLYKSTLICHTLN